jgi:hypothetical protein
MEGLIGITEVQEDHGSECRARIFSVKQEREFECRVTESFEFVVQLLNTKIPNL